MIQFEISFIFQHLNTDSEDPPKIRHLKTTIHASHLIFCDEKKHDIKVDRRDKFEEDITA